MPNLPKPAAQWKVLPALVNSLEYGGGSAKALEPLLIIAKVLNEEEMQEQVVPTVVKLFANTDRSMRIPLLERLPNIVEYLTSKASLTRTRARARTRNPNPQPEPSSTSRPRWSTRASSPTWLWASSTRAQRSASSPSRAW